MCGMDEEQEENRSASSWALGPVWLITALIASLVLYVLSTGPAVMLRERGLVTQETLRLVYAPIFWLSRFEVVSQSIEWYCKFWI